MLRQFKINRWNSKGFLLRDVVISVIISMAMIAILIIVFQIIATNYNKTSLIDPTFKANYQKLDSLTSSINSANNVSSGSGGTSFLGQFDVVFNSFFSVVGVAYSAYGIMFNSVASIISEFTFLPKEIVSIALTALLSALSVYILFSVISATTRGRI